MRVIFASNDPMETLHNLKYKYSYRTFIEMYEYLEAKDALEEDARKRFSQQIEKNKR